ncbi:hypothetical protein [Mesorhizobium sp. M1378]|uniref:hypothetical protein n=1 Tax=Mesorhizobium sp. M1378 TaxID=2957092 RepID=UPI00333B53DA
MTPSIDTKTAIDLVRRQLERYLPRDLEAWARRWEMDALEKARRSGLLEPDGPTVATVGGRLIDHEKAVDLIAAAAAGDKQADAQVSATAIWLLERGRGLPDTFRELEISLWRARGPKPRGNRARNLQYCMAISMLQEHGFSPTRNRAAHGDAEATESGCSILSKALAGMGRRVSEQALEKIWEKSPNR